MARMLVGSPGSFPGRCTVLQLIPSQCSSTGLVVLTMLPASSWVPVTAQKSSRETALAPTIGPVPGTGTVVQLSPFHIAAYGANGPLPVASAPPSTHASVALRTIVAPGAMS